LLRARNRLGKKLQAGRWERVFLRCDDRSGSMVGFSVAGDGKAARLPRSMMDSIPVPMTAGVLTADVSRPRGVSKISSQGVGARPSPAGYSLPGQWLQVYQSPPQTEQVILSQNQEIEKRSICWFRTA
jgi:hypothetical protein